MEFLMPDLTTPSTSGSEEQVQLEALPRLLVRQEDALGLPCGALEQLRLVDHV
jgi:hypothetical protein